MWNIQHIYAENICSFKKLEYAVKQGVATLIFGENLDDTNQQRNGSGKSALIESISLALTGDYLRDIKSTEELINDASDSLVVELQLKNDYDGRTMVIRRTMFRKEAQKVSVEQFDTDGNPTNVKNTTQPTVNDYNKFILGEIGLSKDNIYSNFILSRNHYVSFLSAKDKDKKELINRFSNGVMVDESIAALEEDMQPIVGKMSIQHDDVVRYEARIETINEQIANAEQNHQSALQSRAGKIAGFEEKIAGKRAEIRELTETINKANERLDLIDKNVGDELEALEKGDKSLEKCYETISELFAQYKLQAVGNVIEQSERLGQELTKNEGELEKLNQQVLHAAAAVLEAGKKLAEVKESHQKMVDINAKENEQYAKEREVCTAKLSEVARKISDAKDLIREYRQKSLESSKAIESLKVKLHGAITCPECGHQFVLNCDNSVEELRSSLEAEEKNLEAISEAVSSSEDGIEKSEKDKAAVNSEIDDIDMRISKNERDVRLHTSVVDEAERAVKSANADVENFNAQTELVKNRVKSIRERIANLRKTMFDSAFDIIDSAISRGENYVKEQQDKKKFAKEAIAQYEESIEQLKKSDVSFSTDALKAQIADYQAKLQTVRDELAETTAQHNVLKEQKEHFVAFKTYLANTKINAISQIINSFLEEIGSSIRVSIDGYRVLKSGKLSEKITINILRDGVDDGSFGRHSRGEQARVELASILAMQTLTNVACEDGKGFDGLIVDEILDATDESGYMAFCDALNMLHKTSLIITQGAVSEGYEHRLVIRKQNGESKIGG